MNLDMGKKQRGKGSNGGAPKKPAEKPVGGEVIHVAFGPGGGRIQHALPVPPEPEPPPLPPAPSTGEPVTDVFSPREVAKLMGLTVARLRNLDKSNVVSPSATRNGRKAYTFQDLIALRATHGLLAQNVRLKDVVQAIRNLLPQ